MAGTQEALALLVGESLLIPAGYFCQPCLISQGKPLTLKFRQHGGSTKTDESGLEKYEFGLILSAEKDRVASLILSRRLSTHECKMMVKITATDLALAITKRKWALILMKSEFIPLFTTRGLAPLHSGQLF